MSRTVWWFGLIAGGILSGLMILTLPLMERIGDAGLVLGYSTMVLAFLFIFFGTRSYRDSVGGGSVSFGRAFAVGALIALVGSACYVATWEVIYYKFTPNFGEKYAARMMERARAKGASQAELAKKAADLQKFVEDYKKPAYNVAMTFVEPFPVGLLIALISAGILRRRRGADGASPSGVASLSYD
jgi:hypothetical protein